MLFLQHLLLKCFKTGSQNEKISIEKQITQGQPQITQSQPQIILTPKKLKNAEIVAQEYQEKMKDKTQYKLKERKKPTPEVNKESYEELQEKEIQYRLNGNERLKGIMNITFFDIM